MNLFLFTKIEQIKNFPMLQRGAGVAAGFPLLRLMLSVLIETRNHEDALARTLSSLVSGAVEGVVREVIVCDSGSTDLTHKVAEQAGCNYLQDCVTADAVRKAKGDWLLILEPGAKLVEGWIDAVLVHAGATTSPARFTRSRYSPRPLLERLRLKRRPLGDGLLITRRDVLGLTRGDGTATSIASAVSTHRLDAEIIAAPTTKA